SILITVIACVPFANAASVSSSTSPSTVYNPGGLTYYSSDYRTNNNGGSSVIPGGYQTGQAPTATGYQSSGNNGAASAYRPGAAPTATGYKTSGNNGAASAYQPGTVPTAKGYKSSGNNGAASAYRPGTKPTATGYKSSGTQGASPIKNGYKRGATPKIDDEDEKYGNSPIPGGYHYNPEKNLQKDPSTMDDLLVAKNTDIEPSKCAGVNYPTDINNHWSEKYIRDLYDQCVTKGYSNGTFRPDNQITRVELLKMALSAKGIEPANCYDNDCGTPFLDIQAWESGWVKAAYDRGIVKGNGESFRPNDPVNRAEAVKIILETYGENGLSNDSSSFDDVSGWSTGYIEKAYKIRLINGTGNGKFSPEKSMTRAEASKVLAKIRTYKSIIN
ncbi:hypothetical protein GF340_06235, partial [Candidatus Peregrinibacteria bacterium]|nr:hypothetical protein [Candidatus Peregrinibacteria bacterium]